VVRGKEVERELGGGRRSDKGIGDAGRGSIWIGLKNIVMYT
jgi:hypothetical protein